MFLFFVVSFSFAVASQFVEQQAKGVFVKTLRNMQARTMARCIAFFWVELEKLDANGRGLGMLNPIRDKMKCEDEGTHHVGKTPVSRAFSECNATAEGKASYYNGWAGSWKWCLNLQWNVHCRGTPMALFIQVYICFALIILLFVSLELYTTAVHFYFGIVLSCRAVLVLVAAIGLG